MKRSLPRPSGTHLERRGAALALLIATATLLELAAGIGLAYVAGFGKVRGVLTRFDAVWLLVVVGALLISFIGYYQVYQGIFRVEGGPRLSWRHMTAVVAAGFSGFLSYNGGALDAYVLQSAGADETEAKARAAALAGLEHGVLAIGGTITAIIVLVLGLSEPSLSYTLPWAIIPIPGFLLGFWVAERYRGRFQGKPGLRRRICIFLDSIHLIRVLFAHPLRWGAALAGMALFWAAEAFAAWAGLAAFGFHMDAAALFVGFATGMVFTRRTGPLAGAGVLALLLPLTLLVSGAPLAIAIVGVFVYRLLALWLPLPVSLAVLATLRKLPELAEALPGGGGEPSSEAPPAPAGQLAAVESATERPVTVDAPPVTADAPPVPPAVV
jgi:uncharacterized membrane protein YbhN (UPF0104 family)